MATNAALKREAGARLADMIDPSATSGPVESLRSINPELMTTIDEAAGVARVSSIGVDAIDDPAADDVTVPLSELSGVPDDGPDSVAEQLDTAEFAVTSGEFDPSAAAPESESAFITDVNGRLRLTQYQTSAKENKLFSLGFPDESELQDFVDNIRALRSGAVESPQFERSADVVERTAERRERRDVREAAREAAREAGVDLDEFGIDARADGTIVLQDRDTNQTRTIDPDEDLGNAIAEQTDGDSFEPTSSSSSIDTISNVPSVDDLGGGRLAAIAAIGAAILYGATQS
jgi:pyruvate/2-oxoglutarate dehydrogenase complex dihydrolipoamide acyltransferase (E2) component